jgi:hypothetical protein
MVVCHIYFAHATLTRTPLKQRDPSHAPSKSTKDVCLKLTSGEAQAHFAKPVRGVGCMSRVGHAYTGWMITAPTHAGVFSFVNHSAKHPPQ